MKCFKMADGTTIEGDLYVSAMPGVLSLADSLRCLSCKAVKCMPFPASLASQCLLLVGEMLVPDISPVADDCGFIVYHRIVSMNEACSCGLFVLCVCHYSVVLPPQRHSLYP